MAKRTNDDEPNDDMDNVNDDTFGLPEIEYQPINRDTKMPEEDSNPVESNAESQSEETAERENQSSQYTYVYDDQPEPVWPRILGVIIFVIVLAGGAYFYFKYWKPKKEREARELAELAEKKKRDAKNKARLDSLENIRLAREQWLADSLANAHPAEGTIETLSERTGRYYVVVSSDIDDDLLMDFAKRLSVKGVNTKIIPPFRNVKFFRLAIADEDTYMTAQAKADQMKADFGPNLWVLKY